VRTLRIIRSRKQGKVFWLEDSLSSLSPEERLGRESVVEIRTDSRFQEFLGFGGAFTEAAATVFSLLSEERQEEILSAYFDRGGHNYRFCRTHMNSCDFSLGNYSYLSPGDTKMEHFSIQRDKQVLIPLIKRAQAAAAGEIRILASPWSPPGWMKDTGKMNGGGRLLEEYRELWARYFCRYIREYQSQGITLWGVTVQNEPEALQTWDSCLYTPEQERDFVRDYLGPQLEKEGLGGIRILIHDQWRDRLYERSRIILSDPEASRYIWGAGFHWYEGDNFQNLEYFHQAFPDKSLLFTEGCQEYGTHHGSWELGERYAFSIINDLNRWTRGWIDWNLLLDMTGGPNHVYNLCSAPILADPATDRLFYQSSFYYIGHFSRYIRPGAERLAASPPADLPLTAFRNPDGSVAVVLLNRQDLPREVILEISGTKWRINLEPRSIVTALDSP